MIQLREKELSGADFLEMADELRGALEGTGCAFTVNDRVDIALACGADGVHLGQGDMPLLRAKAVAGGRLGFGVSAGKPDWAVRAHADGADYIGVGPIYRTGSKADAREPIGPDGLKEIRQHAPGVPIVAIGGIAEENLVPVLAAGAHGVAVIGAVMGAKNPEAAARGLRNRIEEARA